MSSYTISILHSPSLVTLYPAGIFAYLNYRVPRTRRDILQTLIKGLQRLEYRGYDSAGKTTTPASVRVCQCVPQVIDTAQDVNSGLVSWILAAQWAWSVSSSTDVAEAVSRYLCEGDYCAVNLVFSMLSPHPVYQEF